MSADLLARLEARLDGGEPFWLPEVAQALVDAFWTEHLHLNSNHYTTAAWCGEPEGRVQAIPGAANMVLEPLPAALSNKFSPSPADPIAAAKALERALNKLAACGLRTTVSPLVRSVHAINEPRAGYDLSHSEPSIPFSILVSFPLGEPDADVRLAESVLHEAMHLHLTLIEGHVQVVGQHDCVGYSPWQRSTRPALGLLHGLYVFAAIDWWMARLLTDPATAAADRAYAARRRKEIAAEMREVANFPQNRTLTVFGRKLAGHLLSIVGRSDPSCSPSRHPSVPAGVAR